MKNFKFLLFCILSFSTFISKSQIVKFEPFTKTNAIYGGLECKEITLKLVENDMLSQNIGLAQNVELKLNDLSGLESVDGKVYFGMKLEIYKNSLPDALYTTEDLYNGTGEMDVTDELGLESAISPSYDLSFKAPYFVIGDTIIVKVNFYDKMSDRSLEVSSVFFVHDGQVEYPSNIFTNASKGTALEFFSVKEYSAADNFDQMDKIKAELIENDTAKNLTSAAVNLSKNKKYFIQINGLPKEIISSSWSITNRFGDVVKTLPVTYKIVGDQIIVDMKFLEALSVKNEQYFAILTLSNKLNFNSFVGILKFKLVL